jgi:hypothetical protein
MTTTATQPLPSAANIRQSLPAGFDGGNGNTKLVLGDTEIRCPAYVLPIHSELYDVPLPVAGGLVEYVSGDRSDLMGQRWLSGFPAYQQSPNGCLRIVDDKRGKITYGLQTLLGSIATQPHQDFWHLSLVASIQDAQVFGADLKNVLKGGHTVKFNGAASYRRLISRFRLWLRKASERSLPAAATSIRTDKRSCMTSAQALAS